MRAVGAQIVALWGIFRFLLRDFGRRTVCGKSRSLRVESRSVFSPTPTWGIVVVQIANGLVRAFLVQVPLPTPNLTGQ